jgi:hypothetical protein
MTFIALAMRFFIRGVNTEVLKALMWINTVMNRIMQLFVELQEKKPGIMRAIGKGIAAGIGAVALGAVAAIFGFDLSE